MTMSVEDGSGHRHAAGGHLYIFCRKSPKAHCNKHLASIHEYLPLFSCSFDTLTAPSHAGIARERRGEGHCYLAALGGGATLSGRGACMRMKVDREATSTHGRPGFQLLLALLPVCASPYIIITACSRQACAEGFQAGRHCKQEPRHAAGDRLYGSRLQAGRQDLRCLDSAGTRPCLRWCWCAQSSRRAGPRGSGTRWASGHRAAGWGQELGACSLKAPTAGAPYQACWSVDNALPPAGRR